MLMFSTRDCPWAWKPDWKADWKADWKPDWKNIGNLSRSYRT